jgi:hypothetical protein
LTSGYDPGSGNLGTGDLQAPDVDMLGVGSSTVSPARQKRIPGEGKKLFLALFPREI